MKKNWNRTVFIFGSLTILVIGTLRFGSYQPRHENREKHAYQCSDTLGPHYDAEGFEIVKPAVSCTTLKNINDQYLQTVKPIFEAKCLMCHGQAERLPLYALVPPASLLLKRDMREAKKHMNMTDDFPFEGHGSAVDDLEAIQKVVETNSMPPWQYKLMHWRSSPTNRERQAILGWVQESQRKLKP